MVVKREIQGVPVRVSDDLYEIFETELGNSTDKMIEELRKTGEEYPNHDVIEFLGDDPASFRMSIEILTGTSFGFSLMNAADGGAIGILARNASQRPALVKDLAKETADGGIQTAQELIEFVNQHPEETQTLIDFILNAN